MLLKNPKQFNKIAREWAVKYAGAPQDESEASAGFARGDDEDMVDHDAELAA